MLFNASERKGIFAFLLLIISTIVIPRYFLAQEADFFLLPADIAGDSLLSTTDTNRPPATPPFPAKVKRPAPVELNTADSATLVKIKGIGPYYAAKIIRYRKQLGGFYSVKQLNELNMKHFNVDSCAHLFQVNPALIQPADLDTMSFKALLRHPYLAYEDVQLIFNAKQQYGHITYDTLKDHKVLTFFKLKKIKPYFK